MASRLAPSTALSLLQDPSLPLELDLRESSVHGLGVWSRGLLRAGTHFGPFLGKLRPSPINPNYAWQVTDPTGQVAGWIDASETGVGNWMKYVRNTTFPYQHNLTANLTKGQIYYQVTQDIEVGEELLLCDKKTLFPELDDLLQSEPEDSKTGGSSGADYVGRDQGGLFDFDFSQHSELSDPLGGLSHDSSDSPEPRSLFGKDAPWHQRPGPRANGRTYPCLHCDRAYDDRQRLDEHMLIDHLGQESSSGEYKCDQCPKVFGWKSNLIRHQAAHEEGRRYVCENCRKVFTDPSNLQRHIRSQHIGARSHACPECGKTFATSSGLKQHTHIHSSVKPFQCEVCLKSYTQFSNLCRHKRMHADCRLQIKCHKCGQAFSTVTSLSKHKRFCEGGPPTSSSSTGGSSLLAAAAAAAAAYSGQSDHKATSMNSLAQQSSHPQPPSGNPLMFYPRPGGFSFYPPSLVAAYPMFSGGSALHPHASLLAANPLLLAAKKPDSPDSSQLATPVPLGIPPSTLNGGVSRIDGKREKRASEGSESEISDDVSSAGISDDVDVSTGSEPDSESENDRLATNGTKHQRRSHHHHHHMMSGGSPRPEAARNAFSPKHAAIYPDLFKERALANGALKSLTPVSCPPADAPFDLSMGGSGGKARLLSSPKTQKEDEDDDDAHHHDEQPLDLRVDHKKAPRIIKEERHRTHVFGGMEPRKTSGTTSMLTMCIPERTTPLTSLHETIPGGASPTTPKFPMAHPRPIHPLLVAPPQLYKAAAAAAAAAASKYPSATFPSGEPLMMPLPPRYPFLGPLMNGLGNGGVNGSSAFDMLRSQMEKMGKPYQDVLAPHVNKLRGRYSCKFCGKIFPRSANLTRHLRTHTGEQPYKCKYCERSFSISSNLQRHVRNIHNKEKPFKCPLCDRCFGQQTNLDRHLKKHESDGPTILDDSPKSSDLNEKDDAYFDEIRNFIGKVTDPSNATGLAPLAPLPPPPPPPQQMGDGELSPKRRKRAHDEYDDNEEERPLTPSSIKASPARANSAPGSPQSRERDTQVAYEVMMKVNGEKSGNDEPLAFCKDLAVHRDNAVEV